MSHIKMTKAQYVKVGDVFSTDGYKIESVVHHNEKTIFYYDPYPVEIRCVKGGHVKEETVDSWKELPIWIEDEDEDEDDNWDQAEEMGMEPGIDY